MTLTKADIAKKIADDCGFMRGEATEIVEKLLDMALISGRIFGGQDGGLGCQAMAERVERRVLFAGFGTRAGGMLGVGAIDGGAINGGGTDWSGCC